MSSTTYTYTPLPSESNTPAQTTTIPAVEEATDALEWQMAIRRTRIPASRVAQINAYLRRYSYKQRCSEINQMKTHLENYFCPVTVGEVPYLNYLYAYYKRQAKLNWQKYIAKKQLRLDQARYWFEEGGRQAHYYRKHHYGQLAHTWLNDKITKVTKMTIDTDDGELLPLCCEHQCQARLRALGLPGVCMYADEDVTERAPKKKRRSIIMPMPRWDKTAQIFKATSIRPDRSSLLVEALHNAIRKLRDSRRQRHDKMARYFKRRTFIKEYMKMRMRAAHYDDCTLEDCPQCRVHYADAVRAGIIQHQGDLPDAHGDQEPTMQEQAGNVILERQTDESETHPVPTDPLLSYNLSSNDRQPQYDEFLNRWVQFDTLEWNTSHLAGDQLAEYKLPFDFVLKRSHTSTTSFFQLFQYWRGDMEVKIQLNSNPFQVGQLQCSWRYMDLANKNVKFYTNVQSLSQTTHTLISANDNNAAVLYIPYKNIKSSLPTTSRSDSPSALDLGRLRIYVLNALHAPNSSYHGVDVSIWVRFLNGSFSGMKASDVGTITHEGLLDDIKKAELHVNIDGSIDNTDKPPVTTAQQPVIVQSNQSFCLGKDVTEPIYPLRLSAAGQAANVESMVSETKISDIANIYGYVKTFTWHYNDASGSLLTTIDASPMFNLNEYAQGTEKADRWYNLPPVAILSEMFELWRGELEMRLDIIATDFHRGKLLVCYVPRELGSITYTQALGSPHVIFDLRDRKQFNMSIPWITNLHYWQRRYGNLKVNDQRLPPGRIHIFIQNRLVPMENVRDRVDINLYWRGGKDFSVAIPATSALSLPWNALANDAKVEVRAIDSYYPYYVGQWRYFGDGTAPILRYGAGADHVAQFHGVPAVINNKYFKYVGKKPLKANVYTTDAQGKEVITETTFLFGVIVADGDFRYMAMCSTEAQAKLYLDYQAFDTYKKKAVEALSRVDDKDLGSLGGQENPIWESVDYTPVDDDGTGNDAVIINHEGDERQDPGLNTATITYPKFYTDGSHVYREQFTDLKDVARRYQPIGQLTFTKSQATCIDSTFPLYPWGLPVNNLTYTKTSKNMYQVVNREGNIPIICAPYQFYRGSLRYRFVFGASKLNTYGNFAVVHYPFRQDTRDIKIIGDTDVDSVMLSNYGFHLQSAVVNNVMSVEVPFYLNTNSVFPNPMSSSGEFTECNHLGTLGVASSASDLAQAIIFYSFGDDAQLSCFQGWPSMILRVRGYENIEHQGLGDWLMPSKPIDIKVDLNDVLNSPEMHEIRDMLKGVADCTVENLVSQLGHICLNPTPTQVSWGIISILMQLKLINISTLPLVSPVIRKICEYFRLYYDREKPDQDVSGVVVADHQGSLTEDVAEAIAMLYGVLSIILGIDTKKGKASFYSMAGSFINNVPRASKSYQLVLIFIKNVVQLFQKLLQYIAVWQNPDLALETLADSIPTIKLWSEEAHILINIENESKILTLGSDWAQRMEACYMFGTKLYTYIIDYEGNKIDKVKIFASFNTLYKQICEKRDAMFRRGKSVVSRKDPFGLYLYGAPGVGKSVLASELLTNICKDLRIPYQDEIIFTLQNGAKYWNGCRSQPVILLDDFLSVNTGTIQEEAIRAYMEIKSPAVLNPPMAHLQDKELRYAPEIMCVLSNHLYPPINHVDLVAFYRRRDLLVHVELCDKLQNEGITRISGLTRDELNNTFNIDVDKYEHLQFKIAQDVTGGMTGSSNPTYEGAEWLGPFNYSTFYNKLKLHLREYRVNQDYLYQKRIQLLNNKIEQMVDEPAELSDVMKQYQRLVEGICLYGPKQHADYFEYLNFIHAVVSGVPVSHELCEQLIDLNEHTREKFHKWAANEQNTQHQMDITEPSDAFIETALVESTRALPRDSYDIIFKDDSGTHVSSVTGKTILNAQQYASQISKFLQINFPDYTITSKLVVDPTTQITGIELKCSDWTKEAPDVVNLYNDEKYKLSARVLHLAISEVLRQDDLFLGVTNTTTHIRTLKIAFKKFLITSPKFNQYMQDYLSNQIDLEGAPIWEITNKVVAILDKDGRSVSNYIPEVLTMSPRNCVVLTMMYATLFHMNQLSIAQIAAHCGDDQSPQMDPATTAQSIISSFDTLFQTVSPKVRRFNNDMLLDGESSVSTTVACKHVAWTPTTVFENGSWMICQYGIQANAKIIAVKDDICPTGCCFGDTTWWRATMSTWKRANPTQCRRLKKLKVSERPRCLQEGARPEYTWWECLTVIKDTIADIIKRFIRNMYEKLKNIVNCVRHIDVETLCCIIDWLITILRVISTLICMHAVWKSFSEWWQGKEEGYYPPGHYCNTWHDLTGVQVYKTAGEYWKWSRKTDKIAPESTYTQNAPRKPKTRGNKSNFPKFFKPETQHEGVFDDGSNIVQHLRRNVYYLHGPNDIGKQRILGLGGQYFLACKHYFEYFNSKGYTEIYLTHFDSNLKHTLKLTDIKQYFRDEYSTGVIELPRQVAPVRALYKRFQDSDTMHIKPLNPVIYELRDGVIGMNEIKLDILPTITIAASTHCEEQILNNVYSYNYGGPGVCCSVIYDKHTGKILGVHVAGTARTKGYGEVLCRESFEDFFSDETMPTEIMDVPYVTPGEPPKQFEGQFYYMGQVEDGLDHHQSPNTQIVPSLIAGVNPITREPAPLAQGDPRVPEPNYSPLYAGVHNMHVPTKDFDLEVLDKAAHDLELEIINKMKPVVPELRPLTYKEAIVGIPGLDYYDSLDMSTSEGFPLSRMRPVGASNKSWLFDISEDRETVGVHHLLKEIMDYNMRNRLNGEINPIVHDDCLKDALINIDKIPKPGKTRIFSISPVQYTIHFRQFFNHFLASFKTSRLNLEHAVGIAVNGFEWGMLVRYLCSTGASAIVTGDYSNFGPGFNHACMQRALNIMIAWHEHYAPNKTHKRIRRCLADEIIYALHCCHKYVYGVYCGMPSGNPATVEINSLVNMLYIRCAWLEIMGNQPDYAYFMDHYYLHVRLCTYGDDLILSVTDEVKDKFNSQTLSAFFDKYNIKYTDAAKSGEIQKYTPLSEATFLKRGFRPHPTLSGQWLAPLEESGMLDVANWCHQTKSIDEATKDSAVACASEAFGWGPIYYSKLITKLENALMDVDLKCTFRTWDDWDKIHFKPFYTTG